VRKRNEILRKIFFGIFYRIIRTSSFPNPTYSSMNLYIYIYICYIFSYIAAQVRSRSTRKTTNDSAANGNNENPSISDRKGVRSQRTIATADIDTDGN
jgi:hypothetical protein